MQRAPRGERGDSASRLAKILSVRPRLLIGGVSDEASL
jgi:hypothetical protein